MFSILWFVIIVESVIARVERPFFMPEFDISVPEVAGGACRTDGDILAEATRNHSLWAMQMWDATAQGSVGALYGNTWQLGHFDECLKQVTGPIKVQYCLLTVQYNMSYTGSPDDVAIFMKESAEDRRRIRKDILYVGVCVPAACSSEDLQFGLQMQMAREHFGTSYNVTVESDRCTTSLEDQPWTVNEICFGLFILSFIIISIIGNQSKNPSTLFGRTLKCFSVPRNIGYLFRPYKRKTRDHFLVFDGIRVLAMVGNVLAHRFVIDLQGFIFNYRDVELRFEGFHAMLSVHVDLLVDIFLFMSAVLATYLMCSKLLQSPKKRVNFFREVFKRIIRLAPTYYLLLWFQAGVAHRLGTGPLWNSLLKLETEACQNYWWANALFFNNYMPVENDCMMHFWYLGCDMQFFVLMMGVVYILFRRATLGWIILGVLIAVSAILPPIAVNIYGGDPMLFVYEMFNKTLRSSIYFSVLHRPSHLRAFAYILGIATGYFLHLKRNSTFTLSPSQALLSLLGSLLIIWAPMALGVFFYTAPSNAPGLAFTTFYSFIRRPTFAIGLACLFLTHRFTYTDHVAWFSRNRVVQVLSKLSYIMYLIHYPYIYYSWAQTQTPRQITRASFLRDGISDIALTSLPAAIIFVLIEQPLKNVYREIFSSEKQMKSGDDIKCD